MDGVPQLIYVQLLMVINKIEKVQCEIKLNSVKICPRIIYE